MNTSLSTTGSLSLWHEVLVAGLKDDRPDLTMRQLAVLLSVFVTPPPHTVRGLARSLAVSKPAVTRALDRLSMLGLVRRKRDPRDGRNVLVQRTIRGSVYLTDLADQIGRAAGADSASGEVARAA